MHIMKTIIVATDFSAVATNAMNYAADLAKEINASLLLFHAYQVPVSMAEVPVVLVSAEELRKDAEEKLAELKSAIGHITSNSVKVYLEARLGDVVDELETLCDHIRPFAVVMGTKGATGLEKVLFGSTTLVAIRHLTWPVICVPPGKEFGKGIRKVGFACDFKQVVNTTPTEQIKDLVKEMHAEFHVLNVDHKDRHFKASTPEESLMLHTMFEELRPSYHFIDHEDIERGINQFAEENNLDLVITIPKKHKLLDGLFHKSSSRQLVFESHVPVMCVHE
jgi:nucleotide-binding universal stress UspA family protein